MPTLNEFIEQGMAFFSGNTIKKEEATKQTAAAVAEVTKDLTAAQALASEANSKLQAVVQELAATKSELAATSAELEKAKAAVANLPSQASAQAATILSVAGVSAVPANVSTTQTSAAGGTFVEVVKANMAAGMKKPDAVASAIRSNPELYAEYRATGGPL